MNLPSLYVVLMFMGSVSVDPNVSLVPQFATFHFADDRSGQQICDLWRKQFNALMVRDHATALGRFECHVMTADELARWQPTPPMF